ncbi:VanW family protein [Candidatus Oscillochloris fontis]|uniref:VanW family protein n=1 Tax=Candidatus Oscillochloris fontis TaxID=2496868 RepID=UPI001EE8149A|nr:VanW family protein [Candidatus Oscillochloris fontis]
MLLTLGTLLVALAMVVLLFGERGYAQRIYPNISVRGVMVGGMHWTAARRAIEQQHAAFLQQPITIRYAEEVWQPSAAELGIQLEIDRALEEALAIGRSDVRAENVRITAAVWEQGLDVPLHLSVDQAVMQRYLMHLATQVEQVPRNADVALRGAEIWVTAEAWGVQVLVDEMLTEMTAAAQSLTPQVVELRTRSLVPRVRDADLAASEAYLRTLLAGPIRLRSPSSRCRPTCSWEWPVAQLASWVSLRPTTSEAGRPSIQVSIDQAAIRQALRPIAESLREEGTLPRVDWNGGELRIITPGDAGRGLDAAAALVQINVALVGGERDLVLPLIPLPPPVNPSNLNSLGITTRLGLGVSSFAKSEAYRITNIRAGARQMHGILIPPGATFSFNQNLGPVTAAQGFVEGYAIIDNRTQKEWGGGLCQVSTTVFRAAFWGGLPITERHEHSFRIGWYEELGEPPGLDAAIFTGVYDLRFTNDTGGWLLMQSSVDLQRQRLSVALYGSPTGRTVRMDYTILKRTPAPTEPVYVDDPEQPVGSLRQSDTARGGLEVEVYRWVYQEDQLLARNTFGTTFKPWPDIFVRGTRPIQ